ncbi:MAG: hypothetical protein PVF07_10605 [Thiogranum sp.]|jgi:hypothetical protein
MTDVLRDTRPPDHQALFALIDTPLRIVARRAVRVWFNRDRLDQLLSENIGAVPHCELIYAIDAAGRQVSSNIGTHFDRDAYGQDLSERPYSVSLSVLSNPAFGDTFVGDTYISRVSGCPCVTAMYGVTSGPTALGFIAVDIDISSLSRSETAASGPLCPDAGAFVTV